VLKASRTHTAKKSPRLAEGQPKKPLVEGNLASRGSPDFNPLDYFMWSIVEREVNKQPHKTPWTGRLSSAPARSFGLGLRLLWRPVGISLKNVHVI
jgi:hypothetical protein